jgi:L-ascorbate metabolism protein UlaG (beta-lactamase superfamily)
MKITKFGHCCLLIEENGVRILTDPGNYTTAQNEVENIQVMLITHEHADHYHVPSIRAVLAKNPHIKIFTNRGVAKLLDQEKIEYELLEHAQSQEVNGVLIEGFGEEHAPIYPELVKDVINTGYYIAHKLWYPGDGWYDPGRAPDILALPVTAPWLKISDTLDYFKKMKPRVAFPVHDGSLKSGGFAHRLPGLLAEKIGSKFIPLEENKETEL